MLKLFIIFASLVLFPATVHSEQLPLENQNTKTTFNQQDLPGYFYASELVAYAKTHPDVIVTEEDALIMLNNSGISKQGYAQIVLVRNTHTNISNCIKLQSGGGLFQRNKGNRDYCIGVLVRTYINGTIKNFVIDETVASTTSFKRGTHILSPSGAYVRLSPSVFDERYGQLNF